MCSFAPAWIIGARAVSMPLLRSSAVISAGFIQKGLRTKAQRPVHHSLGEDGGTSYPGNNRLVRKTLKGFRPPPYGQEGRGFAHIAATFGRPAASAGANYT